MNGNIERIIYIGFAVVLLGIAFSFFFSGYNNYRDYITKSNVILNEDRMVAALEGKTKAEIKGTEVIHQVLETKRLEKYSKMFGLYSDSIVSPNQSYAEIWVSGRKAIDIDTLEIDEASFYSIEFEKDYSGRIIKIQYTLR